MQPGNHQQMNRAGGHEVFGAAEVDLFPLAQQDRLGHFGAPRVQSVLQQPIAVGAHPIEQRREIEPAAGLDHRHALGDFRLQPAVDALAAEVGGEVERPGILRSQRGREMRETAHPIAGADLRRRALHL